jgi:hypothetical protein
MTWKKGESGNLRGRLPGYVGETHGMWNRIKREIAESWFAAPGGVAFLKKLKKTEPREYARLISRVMPADPAHEPVALDVRISIGDDRSESAALPVVDVEPVIGVSVQPALEVDAVEAKPDKKGKNGRGRKKNGKA